MSYGNEPSGNPPDPRDPPDAHGSPAGSAGSADWAPAPGRRPSTGRLLTLVLAAVVPLCLVGFLIWKAPGGHTPQGSSPAHPRPHEPEDKPGKGPLAGRTVVLDPGHNPHNQDHAAKIGRQVDIGSGRTACDTAGTSTTSGYTEARFTLDLAHRVRTALEKQGAEVELTQDGKRTWGPCVTERAAAGNKAHADATVSLHADGAPAGNRGFHVILPKSVRAGDADTSAITGPSARLGRQLRSAYRHSTGERPADYLGDHKGLDKRGDLGGLNLSRVPKVFLECGNMRDPHDARHFTDATWRARAARGVVQGIAGYLRHER